MPTLSYAEQLKHPFWQRRRLERLSASGFACERCHDDETTLHVHHKRYVKGRLAWEYEGTDLTVLCEPCHLAAHDEKTAFECALAQLDADGRFGSPDVCDLVAGWCSCFDGRRSVPAQPDGLAFLVGRLAFFLRGRCGDQSGHLAAGFDVLDVDVLHSLMSFLCAVPGAATDLRHFLNEQRERHFAGLGMIAA